MIPQERMREGYHRLLDLMEENGVPGDAMRAIADEYVHTCMDWALSLAEFQAYKDAVMRADRFLWCKLAVGRFADTDAVAKGFVKYIPGEFHDDVRRIAAEAEP